MVSTLTCYWDYDKILKLLEALHLCCKASVLARQFRKRRVCLQVEGSGFDSREILARMFCHLNGRPRLPASDHVPPHVQLQEEKLVVRSLVIGIPTRVDLTRQKQEA